MIKKWNLQSTILTRIVLFVSVPVLGIMLISSTVSIVSGRKQALAGLDRTQKEICDELATGLVDPLWNYQLDQVRRLVEMKLQNSSFAGLVISDLHSGKTVFTLGKTGDSVSVEVDSAGAHIGRIAREMLQDGKPYWKADFYFSSKAVSDAMWKDMRYSIISALLVLVAIFASILISLRHVVIRPLQELLNEIAEGPGRNDLTRVLAVTREDEIGALRNWFNTFVENQRRIIKEIALSVESLTASTQRLFAAAGQIAETADSLSVKSNTLAQASGQTSGNLSAMADSASHVSANAASVNASIDHMNRSITEVAEICRQELAIAQKANMQSVTAKELIAKLNTAVFEIGHVIGVISKIAGQTNLLALNASIEAASAGEFGRGFAVVAGEVKELSRQTAQATGTINGKVEAMQAHTAEAVAAIAEIASVMAEMNTISQKIATNLDQQLAMIHTIAGEMSGAKTGAFEIAQNVSESAAVMAGVSQDIQLVHSASASTAAQVSQVKASAGELSKMAANLQDLIRKFRV